MYAYQPHSLLSHTHGSIYMLGLRYTMFAAAGVYTLFIAAFIKPNATFILLASALTGFAATCMWVSEVCVCLAWCVVLTNG